MLVLNGDDRPIELTRHPSQPGRRARRRRGTLMSLIQQFELRCSDVHPCGCRKVTCGHDMNKVMADVQRHGAITHGYTPAFYDRAWGPVLAAWRQRAA